MTDGRPNGRKPIQRHMDPYHQREKNQVSDDDRSEGIIEGRNAVIEALRAGRLLDKVYLLKGESDTALRHIASAAREAGAVVVDADRHKLDAMSVTHAHQGVVAVVAVKAYVSLEDLLQTAKERGEPPLIVVCDEISDPHNLGAIIRSAECAGAHGIVIPKRRSAGMTAVVSKTSAGAVEHMAMARVANITSALEELKRAGVWIYGAASKGDKTLWDTDLTGPAAIVIGSEGNGDEPPCGGELRFQDPDTHGRENRVSQRLSFRIRHTVRSAPAEASGTASHSKSHKFGSGKEAMSWRVKISALQSESEYSEAEDWESWFPDNRTGAGGRGIHVWSRFWRSTKGPLTLTEIRKPRDPCCRKGQIRLSRTSGAAGKRILCRKRRSRRLRRKSPAERARSRG